MEKRDVVNALQTLKKTSQKRNFKQSYDLIINFHGLDLKKPEHQVELYAQLHYFRGKKIRVGGFVGPELVTQARECLDAAITIEDFPQYDKKKAKKLAEQCDFFIAQATIMNKVAQSFGRVLGPRGKMPNPKAGCVVPGNANLKSIYERLQKTVKVSVKKDPIFQCSVGVEDQPDDEIIDNIMTVYNALVHALPNDRNNIKNVYLKLTMGVPVKLGDSEEVKEAAKNKKKVSRVKVAPKTEE